MFLRDVYLLNYRTVSENERSMQEMGNNNGRRIRRWPDIQALQLFQAP